MFEESRSFAAHLGASSQLAEGAQSRVLSKRSDTALRAIEWSDLTARLEAARELRIELRLDTRRNIECAGASFSDAAAKFFRSLEVSAQTINRGDLEEAKGLVSNLSGEAGCAAAALVAADFKAVRPVAREDARDEQ